MVSDNAWLELSRFLPYPLFLLPALAALGVSFWLGRWWVAASLANLALWLTLGMGLQWNGGEAGTERVRVMTYNIKVMSAATAARERCRRWLGRWRGTTPTSWSCRTPKAC